jgi:hypothetical protein
MNILKYSIPLAILLKCVIASESVVVKEDVTEVVEEDGFENIKQLWYEKWINRNDLFDHVVTKSVEFIVGFINQVWRAKRPTLAALFIKRFEEVDDVLEKINYTDDDLINLTTYRPELAESHETFFKVIDKIKGPTYQEWAVKWGVIKLFDAKKHASVVPLINALEKRQFKGRTLENAAIQEAFKSGTLRSIKYFVEEFHEHPAITHEEYAYGLIVSWEKLDVFQFLLDQADQGDLEKAKEHHRCKEDAASSKIIDDAFSRAEPAGSRHARPAERAERVRLAKEAFDETPSINLGQKKGGGPEDIIFDYLA